MTRWRPLIGIAAALVAAWTTVPSGQAGAARGEWSSYGGDLGHTRYAPLDQITAANFDDPQAAPFFTGICHRLVKNLADSVAAAPPMPSLPVL